jgi:hypothetical protein
MSFQGPEVLTAGPQSQPQWYWALRTKRRSGPPVSMLALFTRALYPIREKTGIISSQGNGAGIRARYGRNLVLKHTGKRTLTKMHICPIALIPNPLHLFPAPLRGIDKPEL